MLSYDIDDINSFMKRLLAEDDFDAFLVKEAVITTFARIDITGDLNRDYYDSDEQQQLGSRTLAFWKEVKPIAYNIIKGRRLPSYIKVVLKLSNHLMSRMPEELINILSEAKGLYITVRYEQKKLRVMTGLQLKGFTLDRTIENAWDEWVKEIL